MVDRLQRISCTGCCEFIYFCTCASDIIHHKLSIWLIYCHWYNNFRSTFVYIIVTIIVYLSNNSWFLYKMTPCSIYIRYIHIILSIVQKCATYVGYSLQTHTLIILVIFLESHFTIIITVLLS